MEHDQGERETGTAGGEGAPGVRRLEAEEVEAFARDEVMGVGRTLPIVAVTTATRTGRPWIDPAELAGRLGDRARVVLLETGEATWALSRTLPPRLDVYGGAVRVWHPGVRADSDPYDHPLIFIYGPVDIEPARRQVLEEVLGTVPPPARPRATEVQQAVVASLRGGRVRLAVGGERGVLLSAGMPREVLARELVEGQRIPVRPMGTDARGDTNYSAKGLLRTPWERLGVELKPGDVVRGRVVRVEERFALVELLPGAAGIVALKEIDWEPVRRAPEVLKEGEIVTVLVLALAPGERRCQLSIKQAFGKAPRQGIALVPGGRPFPREEGGEPKTHGAAGEPEQDDGHLSQELRAALEDRASLLERVKRLVSDLAEERRARRAAEDRAEFLRRKLAGDLEPATSERAFLQAVRMAHARMFEEGDREEHSLRRMRVGRKFLARLRALDGIPAEKVVEVCAQVAAGMAQEIPGREVHPLRGGDSVAGFLVRPSDGAKAWRCSLQDGTPGARRLHWWSVPGPEGGAVEFASVGVHDDLSIPE